MNTISALKSTTKLALTVVLLSITFTAFSSEKVENTSDDVLINSCQLFAVNHESPAAVQCIYYIHGLVDGSFDENKVVIDESKNLSESDKKLTFTERAYKYRVGALAERGQVPANTYYCLNGNNLHLAVIDELYNQTLSPVSTIKDIQRWVFDALKTICPEFVKNK